MKEFFDAIRRGKLEEVRRALAGNPSLVNARDSDGKTPVIVAAEAYIPDSGADELDDRSLSQLAVVELLASAGADMDAYDNNGRNAISYVICHSGSYYGDFAPMLGALVDGGARIDAPDGYGEYGEVTGRPTPLMDSIHYGSIEAVEFFISKGAKIDDFVIKDDYILAPAGSEYKILAPRGSEYKMPDDCEEKGVAPEYARRTALHMAIGAGNVAAVGLLLDEYAKLGLDVKDVEVAYRPRLDVPYELDDERGWAELVQEDQRRKLEWERWAGSESHPTGSLFRLLEYVDDEKGRCLVAAKLINAGVKVSCSEYCARRIALAMDETINRYLEWERLSAGGTGHGSYHDHVVRGQGITNEALIKARVNVPRLKSRACRSKNNCNYKNALQATN